MAKKADLGIALDGDGDRVVMVDHRGHVLDGDELLYITLKHKLASGQFTACRRNSDVEFGFESAEITGSGVVRVPVGDRHIMSELEKRRWHLGGEPSGHIVCQNNTTTGDGIITSLQVLAAMRHQNQSLADMRAGLMKCPQVLINVNVNQPDFSIEKPRIHQAIKEVEQALGNKGRVLLRRSGTEPLIRVMVEGDNELRVKQLAEQLADVVREELGV